MTITMSRPVRAGDDATQKPGSGNGPQPRPRPIGRRAGRRMAAGVLLVLAAVVVFWQVDLRHDPRQAVLAMARPVPAGQVITEADLRTVRVAPDSGLHLLPAAERDRVVGRSAAVPLAAGSLLTGEQVGPVAWPPPGQAVVAVAVKPGHAPAGLTPGARVVVLVVPAQTTGATSTAPAGTAGPGGVRAMATVVALTQGPDQASTQVVSLLLSAEAAEQVAAAPGDVSLVWRGPVG